MTTNTPTLAQRTLAEFRRLRDEAITKSNYTRFAEAEQMHVIEGMCSFMLEEEEAMKEGFDSIREYIAGVSNASAYAQLLEKAGKIVRNKKGTGGAKAKLAE